MRSGTKYWVGIRHVGDAEWPDVVEELSAADMCRLIVRVIGEVNLAKRLDFCIARTKEEVEKRLTERLAGQGRKSVSQDDSLTDELTQMMREAGLLDGEI